MLDSWSVDSVGFDLVWTGAQIARLSRYRQRPQASFRWMVLMLLLRQHGDWSLLNACGKQNFYAKMMYITK